MLAPSIGRARPSPERYGKPGHENRQNGHGRADEAHDEEDGDERQDQDGRPLRAVENGDDEAEDDPGQHGGRDGGRDAFDERADRTDEGRDEDQGARKKERSRQRIRWKVRSSPR